MMTLNDDLYVVCVFVEVIFRRYLWLLLVATFVHIFFFWFRLCLSHSLPLRSASIANKLYAISELHVYYIQIPSLLANDVAHHDCIIRAHFNSHIHRRQHE